MSDTDKQERPGSVDEAWEVLEAAARFADRSWVRFGDDDLPAPLAALDSLRAKVAQLEAQLKAAALRIDSDVAVIAQLEADLTGKQEPWEAIHADCDAKVAQLEADLQGARRAMNDAQRDKFAAEARVAQLENEAKGLEQARFDALDTAHDLTAKVAQLEAERDDLAAQRLVLVGVKAERDEARAEVERLRDSHGQFDYALSAAIDRAEKAEAEIEQLRDQRDEAQAVAWDWESGEAWIRLKRERDELRAALRGVHPPGKGSHGNAIDDGILERCPACRALTTQGGADPDVMLMQADSAKWNEEAEMRAEGGSDQRWVP